MFKPKAVLLVCLFILIGSLLFGVQLYAQTSQATNAAEKRFEISIGGGWGLYNMTNINKHYIDEFAKEVGIFDDHIDNGPSIFGEVGYFVSPNVSANVGVIYLHGDVEKESISLTTTLVVPQLKINYYFRMEKIDLFLSGGMGWCFGRSSLKSSSNEYKFTARGLGFLASTGASYNLTEAISFGTEIGYRHLATGDLKDKDGDIWEVDVTGTPHKINLDFSGPFILGRLSLRL